MSLTYSIRPSGSSLTIALDGNFTFAENATFRSLVEEVVAVGAAAVTVDLSAVRMLDSAGLSMLVLLRDRLADRRTPITLARPPAQVDRILGVVDFHKLFTIVR